MASVFVTRAVPGDALDRLRAAHQVRVWDGRLPPEPAVLREAVADAEGLLCLLTDRVDGRCSTRLRGCERSRTTPWAPTTLTSRCAGPGHTGWHDARRADRGDGRPRVRAAARRRSPSARGGRGGAGRARGARGSRRSGSAPRWTARARHRRVRAHRSCRGATRAGFRMSVRSTADTDLDELSRAATSSACTAR